MVKFLKIYFLFIFIISFFGCTNYGTELEIYTGNLKTTEIVEPSVEYTNCRIPGIVITSDDTILLYYESRRSSSDYASMDIICDRSTNYGEDWTTQTLACGTDDHPTVDNPVMVALPNNVVLFIYCEDYTINGGCIKIRKSFDGGRTWSDSADITSYGSPDSHDAFALGPGHGVRSNNGTILIPCWYVEKGKGTTVKAHTPSVVTIFYSLDGGESWALSDTLKYNASVVNPSESSIVELSDKTFYLNIRNSGTGYRAVAFSETGYSCWTTPQLDENLVDPTCFGSCSVFDVCGYKYAVLFSNCESSSSRTNLVLKASIDDGATYTMSQTITEGEAGYSDIAVDSRGCIYVFYEVNYGEKLMLATTSYSNFTNII